MKELYRILELVTGGEPLCLATVIAPGSGDVCGGKMRIFVEPG